LLDFGDKEARKKIQSSPFTHSGEPEWEGLHGDRNDHHHARRFGFSRDPVEELSLPGPVELERFLGLELDAGALQGAEGPIAASGRVFPVGDEAALRQTA